jgi:hypothetical protein
MFNKMLFLAGALDTTLSDKVCQYLWQVSGFLRVLHLLNFINEYWHISLLRKGLGGSMSYLTTHTSLSPIWHGFVPSFVNYKKGSSDRHWNKSNYHMITTTTTTSPNKYGPKPLVCKYGPYYLVNIETNKRNSFLLLQYTSLSPIWHGFVPSFVNYKKGCTRLAATSDKVYELLAHGRWTLWVPQFLPLIKLPK